MVIWTYLVLIFVFTTKKTLLLYQALIFQNKSTPSSYACLSKSTIPPSVPQNITVNFGCIPRWHKQSLMEQTLFLNQHLDGKKTHVHGYFFYPKFHQGQSQEGVELGPLIIACEWVKKLNLILFFLIKVLKLVSKNHVVKIRVEALTSYSTFPTFLHLFVDVFILSEVVALHKLGHPIILWL